MSMTVADRRARLGGKQPCFAGKPDPLMMRTGLNAIGAHMQTFLVLTGLTRPSDAEGFGVPPLGGGRLDRGSPRPDLKPADGEK